MRHVVISLFLAALVLGFDTDPASASEVAFIRSLIGQITEDELRDTVQTLEAVGTRYAPSSGNRQAANMIKEKLSSFGLDVRLDEFHYYDTAAGLYQRTSNVVGTKKGSQQPGKIVILAAHFDSVTRRAPDGKTSFQDEDNPAPGADDNATGVAAVLAAARVLSHVELDTTVRFVMFSAEEGGIHGSAHYAAECARKSEDIVAVINLDMIGHIDQEPEDIDIFGNPDSERLLDEMIDNVSVYTPDLLVYRIVDGTYDGSDHGPFWTNGYPAICLMEDYYPSNRHYHTPADTVETLDFSFALRCTRLAVATVGELAGIRLPDQAPTVEEEKGAEWKRDSGRCFLFTMSPSAPHADVIDISVPGIHARRRIVLDTVPEETWATPRFYPVAPASTPAGRHIFIPMIRMRVPGDETGNGILKVVDVVKADVVREVTLGRFPGEGCFNVEGDRYYQPYWGEGHIDVFDTKSFERMDRIPSPHPVKKLQVDGNDETGVGVSPETQSVLIFNLLERKLEKRIDTIASPRDLVLVGKHALVSDYEQSKVFVIDIGEKVIVDDVDCPPRPVHLVGAPEGDRIVSIHEGSSRLGLFRVVAEGGAMRLEEEAELDLEEDVEHASFAEDGNLVYFISAGRQRLFGMDLARQAVVWGMRTGDVRARGGVENILYVRPK
jgi:hypothetical protein